ncbi:hypothetical protein AGMMS49944_30160 [Spirochaetia bacterium]|nr:hypothetical protein AGMMS49944_30160 [Spirochaetia bacterium]
MSVNIETKGVKKNWDYADYVKSSKKVLQGAPFFEKGFDKG